MEQVCHIAIHSIQRYCLIQSSLEPLKLILYWVSISNSENNTPYSYSLVEKLFIVVAHLSLFKLAPRIPAKTMCYILLAFCVGMFEYYLCYQQVYFAYIYFACIFPYFKQLCLLTKLSSVNMIVISTCVYSYHVIRMIIILHTTNTCFPIFSALTLVTNCIVADIAYFELIKRFAQTSLRQEHIVEEYKALFDFIPNPIVIYNSSIRLTNRAASSIKNETLMQIIEQSNILASGSVNTFPHESKMFTLRSQVLTNTAFGSNTALISIVDITEIVKAEKIAASENAKWLFINSLCHQIRTPLSGIECSLSMLEKGIAECDKQSVLKNLNMAYVSITSLRHIVDDSVYLYEDTTSSIAIHNTIFNFSEIISKIKNDFQYETNTKSLTFIIDEHTYPFVINSDKKLIYHSIFTIIMNSFKYTLHGHIRITHSAKTISDTAATLIIIIEDTGVGIDDTTLADIFTVFSINDTKKSEQNTSNGIGLYIVKRLTSLLGGGISISSQKNVGSKFTIWYTVSTMNITKSPTKLAKKSSTVLNSRKVLIVDDNSTNLFVLNSMMKRLKIECDIAHNGAEAVNMYESHNYEMVFMDINMPIMNGYEASKCIKDRSQAFNKDVVIIACSAQNEPISEKLRNYGIDEWLEKPVKFADLSNIIVNAN